LDEKEICKEDESARSRLHGWRFEERSGARNEREICKEDESAREDKVVAVCKGE